MLCLSQDPTECGTVTISSVLSSIGALLAFDDSMDSSDSDVKCKNKEVPQKVRLNDRKVESASDRGAKKLMLATFDGAHKQVEALYQSAHEHTILLVDSASAKKLL